VQVLVTAAQAKLAPSA